MDLKNIDHLIEAMTLIGIAARALNGTWDADDE